MTKKIGLIIGVLAAVLGFSTGEAKAVDLTHSFVVGFDAGFNLDPDLFAWDVLGEYHVTGNVAVGPLLTFAADRDTFLFGASGFAKYKANLAENENLKPYGMIGIGFLTEYEDVPGSNKWGSETTYLIPVGGGFEYWFSDRTAFGSNLLFNITDNIFFSLMFGLRTRF